MTTHNIDKIVIRFPNSFSILDKLWTNQYTAQKEFSKTHLLRFAGLVSF